MLALTLALSPFPAAARAPRGVPLAEGIEHVICRASVATGSMLVRQLNCMAAKAWDQAPDARQRIDDYSAEPALAFAAPENPDILKTGTAPWDTLPRLRTHGRLPYAQLVNSVGGMIRKGECALPGQTAKRFDIDAPFAVQVAPDGTVKQVVVGETGCAGINSLVALTILARARRGDLEPAGNAADAWFGSRLRLTLN